MAPVNVQKPTNVQTPTFVQTFCPQMCKQPHFVQTFRHFAHKCAICKKIHQPQMCKHHATNVQTFSFDVKCANNIHKCANHCLHQESVYFRGGTRCLLGGGGKNCKNDPLLLREPKSRSGGGGGSSCNFFFLTSKFVLQIFHNGGRGTIMAMTDR